MFAYFTKENAAKESLPLIDRSVKSYSYLPKLHAILAVAPAAYKRSVPIDFAWNIL